MALRWSGPALWAVAFAASAWMYGLPWSRDRIALWLVAALLAASLSDLRRFAWGLIVDWLPLFVLLFTYDLLRGAADELMAVAHVLPQLRFDEVLFGGTVPTVWLQERYYDPENLRWWDAAAWVVYTSHFFVPLGVAAGLWVRSRAAFRRYAAMFVTLTFAGFATYALVPAVPPWMASDLGYLEPTVRLVPRMWLELGVEPAAMVFQGGNEYANDVAALPSLHSAYPVLLLLVLWRSAGRVVRGVLLLYPVAMAVALVYGAEHYVADILLGWAYALLAFTAVELVRHRLRRREAGADTRSRWVSPTHSARSDRAPSSVYDATSHDGVHEHAHGPHS